MSKITRTKADLVFDIINYTILSIALLVVVYPLYFVVIASISDPTFVNSGQVVLFPKGINIEGYTRIFNDPSIMSGYKNTIIYTLLGTSVNVLFTIPAAYALSRRDLDGRKLIMSLIVFTMFFSGGLIPTFILIKNLGLYNSIWALILPSAVIPYNLIISRTFFETSIPNELYEASQLDGCNDFKFFAKIVLPLSGSLIAIMVLFYGVGHWNSYFSALMYLRDTTKYPLQLVLRNILIVNQVSSEMMEDVDQMAKKQAIAGLIQYGVIIVAAFPLLIVYPFLQKYFVKGVMIGAVKG